MRRTCVLRMLLAGFVLVSLVVPAQCEEFEQKQNIVYAEVHGIGLVMDVFVPKQNKNHLGIIDVISGAWSSDRGKIRDHMRAQAFQSFCAKGFTVFAIRPGSLAKFNAIEMRDHLNQGIVWVKQHAQEYEIDPQRLGMMGASAGGHLALLTMVTGPTEDKLTDKPNTRVKAVGVFFPPTDLLNFRKNDFDPTRRDGVSGIAMALALPRTPVPDLTMSQEKKEEYVKQVSPALLVKSGLPPCLLIHGDADNVVPLQQSESMLAALKSANVPAELIVKKGGGHPWLTLHEEMKLLANWFVERLK